MGGGGGSDFEKVELSCNHLIILLVVSFSNKSFLIFLIIFFLGRAESRSVLQSDSSL